MPAAHEKFFPATLLGGAARRALGMDAGGPGGVGKVLAVFRRSFYLEMSGPDGSEPERPELVCVGPTGLGAGPLNALCDLPGGIEWEKMGLRPGDAAQICGGSLTVAGGFFFSLADARTWRPNIPPGRPENLSRALAALAGEAGRRAPAEGMGRLIPDIVRGGLGEGGEEDPFLRMAAGGAGALLGWMKNAAGGDVLPGPPGAPGPPVPPGLPMPPEKAEVLIGLGPGLTPSGDDFIGGAMVALRALGWGALADRLAEWALPLAEKRTGRISRAHLACAAEGEGAEALHEAIRAMGSSENISGCVDALDAIGHTSGWDALAGAAAGVVAFALDESKMGVAP